MNVKLKEPQSLGNVKDHMDNTHSSFLKIIDGMKKTKMSNENIQGNLEKFGITLHEIENASIAITKTAEELIHIEQDK